MQLLNFIEQLRKTGSRGTYPSQEHPLIMDSTSFEKGTTLLDGYHSLGLSILTNAAHKLSGPKTSVKAEVNGVLVDSVTGGENQVVLRFWDSFSKYLATSTSP